MNPDETTRRRVPVLKLRVDLTDYASTIERVIELAHSGRGGYISVANVHVAIEAQDDPAFSDLVNDADLVLPDGTPLVWMQRWQGNEDAEQVRGPSLMPMLMKRAEGSGLKVGFFGGTEETLKRLVERGLREFPNLKVTYSYSPPFRELTIAENAKIADEINAAGVQILFVGLGCPKQERWMAANHERIDAVMLGVGAAFDLYAGNLREAPGLISKLGLEWVFRLVQEPRRLFSRYLMVNPRFVLLAGKQLLSNKVRRS